YAILDDDPELISNQLLGVEVIGEVSKLEKISQEKYNVSISIGHPKIRKKIYNYVKGLGFDFVNAIHPLADLAKSVTLGEGVIINSGVVIHPAVELKDNIILGINATVSHDSIIDSHVHISPGVHVTGECKIEECVDIGTGAVILPRKKVKQNSIIGAGAVVNKDIKENVTAVGIPVKVIKENN
ncbi:MAG: NeuD/PglB/VioB family sugar acetyltransferase, partial [bacterium]